ncbi:sensor histidine kinase [Rhizosphaericola mali]|uniref:Signal transduction histidine kinase internal region domain-containing protein n=1 Tax=Rhizosphaericola mali TaxID=2545455 RepID=A0A5P2G2Y1_9BACT|nr:histidine kinase [Rhizosphaericola mali]QES88160.1 hypothetical protein E0W69_005595 [Rhizosphaericola mali]
MQTKRRPIAIHFFFFILFIVLPALVFERLPGESFFTFTRAVVQDMIANITILSFLYLNYYIFIPKLYFLNKTFWYVMVVILYLFIILPIPHLLGNFINEDIVGKPPGPPPGEDTISPLLAPITPKIDNPRSILLFSIHELRRHIYLFFTAFLISFLIKTRDNLAKIKEDNLQAELSRLNAQINPHFLFNTLNSIYALSIKNDASTSNAILNLSGLMRYLIKDVSAQRIPLQKELDYIFNYIELQKARLGNTVNVIYELNGKPRHNRIAPLILITFIENAFKYGINPTIKMGEIIIKINILDNKLEFYISNTIMEIPNKKMESNGIGVENTKARLQSIYPGQYHLNIQNRNNEFKVSLSIDLV